MKSLFIFLSFTVLFIFNGNSQIIQSSCEINDSIRAFYKTDAERIVLRRIYKDSLPFMDSLYIPKTYSDTLLRSFAAVYNLTSLPARDTIITKLNIHSFPDYDISSFNFSANKTFDWMLKLKNNNLNTGNPVIDSIITNYGFTDMSYYVFEPWSEDLVVLRSDSNYNVSVFVNQLDTMYWVYPSLNSAAGDGNNITAEIKPNYVKLIFSYGFGDCPSGCTRRRYWEFNVYYDCKVEYVGSYGSTLILTSLNPVSNNKVVVYPNPMRNSVNIDVFRFTNGTFKIFDFTGKEVLEGNLLYSSTNLKLDYLKTGVYILELIIDGEVSNFKLLKD